MNDPSITIGILCAIVSIGGVILVGIAAARKMDERDERDKK